MDSSKNYTARCLDAYLALACHVQGASAAELAQTAGATAGDMNECLDTLLALHLIEEDPQYAWRYRMGARSIRLGLAGRYVEIRTLASPHLQHLHERTRHKVSLHILDGHLQRSIDICPHSSQVELRKSPEVGYRNGRILRFGATAVAILAFMPAAEAARALASSAEPPSPEQMERDPQFAHLMHEPVDLQYWNSHSPTADDLRDTRDCGFARSRSGIGQAMTAPLFERGARICGGVCLFGEQTDDAITAEHGRHLLVAGARISAALGYLDDYPPRASSATR